MKIWKPDTCDCILEEIYDQTFDSNAGDFTWVPDPADSSKQIKVRGRFVVTGISGGQILFKCPTHQTVDDRDLYDVILNGENRVKNKFLRLLLGHEDIKDLGLEEDRLNPDGTQTRELKTGLEYLWAFEGEGKDRILKVEVRGANLTRPKKTEIETWCDTKFGLGKVRFSATPLSNSRVK